MAGARDRDHRARLSPRRDPQIDRRASPGRRRTDRWRSALTSWKNLVVIPATLIAAGGLLAVTANSNRPVRPRFVIPDLTTTSTSSGDITALEARLAALEAQLSGTSQTNAAQRAQLQAEIDGLRAELARLSATTTTSRASTTTPATTTTTRRPVTTTTCHRILRPHC